MIEFLFIFGLLFMLFKLGLFILGIKIIFFALLALAIRKLYRYLKN